MFICTNMVTTHNVQASLIPPLNFKTTCMTCGAKAVSMEGLSLPPSNQKAEIDMSRPFQSVKEAVALFGERFLVGGNLKVYQKPPPPPPPVNHKNTIFKSDNPVNEADHLARSLERLEAELVEAKLEVQHLKARETATELAVASLRRDFQQYMSKMQVSTEEETRGDQDINNGEMKTEERARYKKRQTLAALLRLCEEEEDDNYDRQWEKQSYQILKKKPIVPLVTDMFHRNKGISMCMLIS